MGITSRSDLFIMTMAPDAVAYAKVPIEEFIFGCTVNVDVYIQLSDLKFVKVVNGGDSLTAERISKYAEKNVEYLYVRKSDYSKYMDKGLTIAGVIINNRDLPQKVRTSVISMVASSVFTELEAFNFNAQVFGHGKIVASAAVLLCQANTDFLKMMDQLATLPDQLFAHSVAVSTMSVMIDRKSVV